MEGMLAIWFRLYDCKDMKNVTLWYDENDMTMIWLVEYEDRPTLMEWTPAGSGCWCWSPPGRGSFDPHPPVNGISIVITGIIFEIIIDRIMITKYL